jgi:AAA family ATP:ADP antiporter
VIVAAWSAITFGALLAAIMVSRPVRDALVLDGDVDQIPWLWTGTFVAFLVIAPIWGKAVTHQPRKLVPRAFHFFAGCALIFYALMRTSGASLEIGYTFYIWSSVLNMLVVSAFWSLLADLCHPGTAKKIYGIIAAGGTIGALVGPEVTRFALEYVELETLFLVMAAFLELAVIGVYQVKRHGARLAEDLEREQPLPPDSLAGLKAIARDRYLMAIAGFVLCTSIAATLVYFARADAAKDLLPDRHARAEWFASLDVWTQRVTLCLQLLVARPLLRWLGPGLVLCILPLVQGAGLVGLGLAPGLAMVAVVEVLSRSTTHGLTRPAREVLFTVVSRDDKYRAKNVIDTLVLRFGDFGAAWMRQGLVAISAGAAMLAMTALPLTLVWVALALVLGAGFRRRVTSKETS